ARLGAKAQAHANQPDRSVGSAIRHAKTVLFDRIRGRASKGQDPNGYHIGTHMVLATIKSAGDLDGHGTTSEPTQIKAFLEHPNFSKHMTPHAQKAYGM